MQGNRAFAQLKNAPDVRPAAGIEVDSFEIVPLGPVAPNRLPCYHPNPPFGIAHRKRKHFLKCVFFDITAVEALKVGARCDPNELLLVHKNIKKIASAQTTFFPKYLCLVLWKLAKDLLGNSNRK